MKKVKLFLQKRESRSPVRPIQAKLEIQLVVVINTGIMNVAEGMDPESINLPYQTNNCTVLQDYSQKTLRLNVFSEKNTCKLLQFVSVLLRNKK